MAGSSAKTPDITIQHGGFDEFLKVENQMVSLEDDVKLRYFVYYTLLQFMTLEKVTKCIAEDVMPMWIKAFTHFSVDPVNNYEILEKLGDRVMLGSFSKYILATIPDLNDESVIASMEKFYLTKPQQASFSQQMGLPKFARTNLGKGITTSVDIDEDLYEAFYGALVQVGDKVFAPGVGDVMGYNMLAYQFKNIDFTIDVSGLEYERVLKEIVEQLGDGVLKNITLEEPKSSQYIMTKDTKSRLKNIDKERNVNKTENSYQYPVVKYDDPSRGTMTLNRFAGKMALEMLQTYGITQKFALTESKKRSLLFLSRLIDPMLIKLKTYAVKGEEHPQWNLLIKNIDGNRKIAMLIVNVDGVKQILGRGVDETGVTAKKYAVQDFLSK
jgi:hypothetical protein